MVDPLAEQYYKSSPFAYVENDPIRFLDPDGMQKDDDYGLDRKGNITLLRETDDETDKLIALDANGNETTNEIEVEKGILDNQKKGTDSFGNNYNFLEVEGDGTAVEIFEFVSENTDVEWGQIKFDDDSNFISTSNQRSTEFGVSDKLYNLNIAGANVREMIHSHPGGNDPSPPDIANAAWSKKFYPKSQTIFKIYQPTKKKYVPFNEKGKIK